ncbi:DUF4331 family protein [Altibacter lentus]|uniref:DUF4331 family protein n=1 Tax=Altibacter lentus TaxID=1223410 RepID=UPI00054EB52B|nr:DUF4331 family protein [Altibacter lentus]
MKTYKFKFLLIAICASIFVVGCSDDDDNVIEQISCSDGIQNGDEEGIDCGGTACGPCISAFTGTFVQEDAMGRPGINTVFSSNATIKNNFNTTIVSGRSAFTDGFEAQLEGYHDVYGTALGIDIDYETNILGLDAPTFAFVLSQTDALQVAPNGTTTYFDGTNALTGRTLSDDVIDISLTLMFGGADGMRFDGNNGTPQLTSDGVDAGDRDFSLPFPYLETPNQ